MGERRDSESPLSALYLIAANLTAAAHAEVLTQQLHGKSVPLSQAINEVCNTWLEVLKRLQDLRPSLFPTVGTDLGSGEDRSAAARLSGLNDTWPPAGLPSKRDTATTGDKYPLPGTVLDGRYSILKAIGRGAMSKVYLAKQLSTGRKVAIKVINGAWVASESKLLNAFRHEVRALAQLNHPNIAQIYDAARTGEILYIAMEYVEGESLRERLRREPKLAVGDALQVLRECCVGLGAAHQKPMIHRDIKPENIMLARDSEGSTHVKLLDFGLSIVERVSALGNPTGQGEFAGTPGYMSPEQLEGQELSTASDVYSLGVVAYEMLAGANPFVSSSGRPIQVITRHLTLSPPQLSESVKDVPARVGAAIMKALEKNPHNRFATATDFAQSAFDDG